MQISFNGNYTIKANSPREAQSISCFLSPSGVNIVDGNNVRFLTGQDKEDYVALQHAIENGAFHTSDRNYGTAEGLIEGKANREKAFAKMERALAAKATVIDLNA